MQASRLAQSLIGITKHSNGIKWTRLCWTCSRGDHHSNNVLQLSSCNVRSLVIVKQSAHRCQKWTQNTLNVMPSQKSFSTTQTALTSKILSEQEIKKSVDTLTDQFMEARELLEDARQSLGTVYFSEDMEDVQTAISETLQLYENLLKQLTPEQKQDVVRTIGLKMEELKAQEQALKAESLT